MIRSTLIGLGLIGATTLTTVTAAPTETSNTDSADTPRSVSLQPTYLTLRDQAANIDSVAAWHDGHGRHWLLATAKSTNQVRVYDAATGAPIAAVGGDDGVELARPNGIAVAGDMALVVERDNARVHVLDLPSLQPIGTFGAEQLRRPYGIWVAPADDDGRYDVTITDDYVNADDSRPTGQALDRRIQQLTIARDGDDLSVDWRRAAGPTEGVGQLHKVESVAGDPAYDRLLLSDESPEYRGIKIFDLNASFTGQTLGTNLFEHDPEGIALVRCGPQSGYWITTDQSDDANRFRIFTRRDLTYRGVLKSAAVINTDGIGVTQTAMPHFPNGALFAVNDDGNVAAIDLGAITRAFGPDECSASKAATTNTR